MSKNFNEPVVYIRNVKQVSLYVKHGVKPVDIFHDGTYLTFVFNKDKTQKLYDLWCNRELN